MTIVTSFDGGGSAFRPFIDHTPLPILKSGSFKRAWVIPEQLEDGLVRRNVTSNADAPLTEPDINRITDRTRVRGIPMDRLQGVFERYMPLFVQQIQEDPRPFVSADWEMPNYENIFASPITMYGTPEIGERVWNMDAARDWGRKNVGRVFDKFSRYNGQLTPFMDALGAVGNPQYPALKAPYYARLRFRGGGGGSEGGSDIDSFRDPRNRLDMYGVPHNTREQEQLAIYKLADDLINAKERGGRSTQKVMDYVGAFLPYVTFGGTPYGWTDHADGRGDALSHAGAEPLLMPNVYEYSVSQTPIEEMLHAAHSRMNHILRDRSHKNKSLKTETLSERTLDAMEDDASAGRLTRLGDDLIQRVMDGRATYDDVGQAIELAANANAVYNRRLDPKGNFDRRVRGRGDLRWYMTADGTPLSGSNRLERWSRHVPSLAEINDEGDVTLKSPMRNLAAEGAASAVNWLLTNPESQHYITHMFPHTYRTVMDSMGEAKDLLEDRYGVPTFNSKKMKNGEEFMDDVRGRGRLRADFEYTEDPSPGWESDFESKPVLGPYGMRQTSGEPKVKRVDGDVPNILSVYGAN